MFLEEKGCMMPEEMTSKTDRETKKFLTRVYVMENYFRFIRKKGGSRVDLHVNLLKILN